MHGQQNINNVIVSDFLIDDYFFISDWVIWKWGIFRRSVVRVVCNYGHCEQITFITFHLDG